MSLLDVLRGVMLDPAEQAAYNANPGAYLERYGYDDVDSADLSEAFGLVADVLPPDQAQAAWQAAAEHGDEPFGGVTPEFDSQVGVDAATTAPTTEPSADLADEPEPTLSFGYGEADFPDAADVTAAGPGDDDDASLPAPGDEGDGEGAGAVGDIVDDVTDQVDVIDDLDAGAGGGEPDDDWDDLDDGWDTQADDAIDDTLGIGDDDLGLDDGGGDLAETGELDGLVDDLSDTPDIGSF